MLAPFALAALLVSAGPAPAGARWRTGGAPGPPPALTVTLALGGVSLLVTGLVVDLGARLEGDPGAPVSAWGLALRARVVGGVALLGVGLCLFALAALVHAHRGPLADALWALRPVAPWP